MNTLKSTLWNGICILVHTQNIMCIFPIWKFWTKLNFAKNKPSILVIKRPICIKPVFWQQGMRLAVKLSLRLNRCLHLLQRSSSSLSRLSSSCVPVKTRACPLMSTLALLSFALTFPNVDPVQRPRRAGCNVEIFAVSSKAHWWDCLALNEPSLPQQMSSCISCRPVGFIDRSSPRSVDAGAGALSSSWLGCWRLLAPLAALFKALSGARLSSYPAPLQPRLRTLVRRLLKIDEKNPAVSPHHFPRHMAGWYSGLLGKDLPGIRRVGLPVLRVWSLEC